jgi:hypothetical protein
MGVPFGSAIFTDKVDVKVVYICNPCANLQQMVNLYIESRSHSLTQAMSVDSLLAHTVRGIQPVFSAIDTIAVGHPA